MLQEVRQYVGIFVFVEHPKRGLVAVARRRSKYKWEDGKLREQSFSGALDPTWHGKREAYDEDVFATLLREGREEVGNEATQIAVEYLDEISLAEPYQGWGRGIAKVCIWIVKAPLTFLEAYRSDISGSGVEFLTERDVETLKPSTREDEKGTSFDGRRMDISAIEALQMGFLRFLKPN